MSGWSNLNIELMDAGSNDTTWGNVTNTNWTAIDAAISRTASVAFSGADRTLTFSESNGSQDVRYLRLDLSGTVAVGGTSSLIFGAGANINKPYIINNGTDGNVVVKNSTGTGITVPSGKTMWVYNNGTNVVDAVTHLSSLSLTTPLPVAQGGTGGNTQATARTGIGAAAAGANSDITSITGLTTPLAVNQGGTGGNTQASARSALGAAASGVNTDITTLNPTGGLQVGTPTGSAQGAGTLNTQGLFINGVAVGTGSGSVTSVNASGGTTGLTFSGGPVVTTGTLTLSGTLAVANGGTGGTTAATARSALGAAASGANSDITSLTGLTTPLAVARGGTGANTASAALAALGGLGVSASSLGTNGYLTLSNGLMLQWGVYTTSGTEGSYAISFPTSFPTACYTAVATIKGNSNVNTDMWVQVNSVSTTTLNVQYQSPSSGNTGYGVYWIAIGN